MNKPYVKRKRFIILLLLVQPLLSVLSFSQDFEVRAQLFDDAEFFFWREDYEEAVYYYLQILELDPGNANINFKAGECFLNIPGKETLAIPHLKKAVGQITDKYRKKSIQENHAPLHAYFYLGNAYRINNELGKALEAYSNFINHPYYYGNYNIEVVENEIANVERAKIIKNDPVKIRMENPGTIINSSSRDFSPAVSRNGRYLAFTSRLKFYDGIFFTSKSPDGIWAKPENINASVGSDGDMYPVYLSDDASLMLLVKQGEYDDDIYISEFENGKWSKANPLNSNINTRRNESSACIDPAGKKLYFSSDRWGSHGGLDIFVSYLSEDGEWGKPENLGQTINTEGDENFPYIIGNNKTLFFSSTGHFNMGGYDIFVSQNFGNGWTEPENIGYPINTTNNNIQYVPVNDGKTGYMAIISPEGFGLEDLYQVSIVEMQKRIPVWSKTSPSPKTEIKKSLSSVNKVSLIDTESGDTLGTIVINNQSDSLLLYNKNNKLKLELE